MNNIAEIVKLWRTEALAEDITKKLAKRAREKETKSLLVDWNAIHTRHKLKLKLHLDAINYTPAEQFSMPIPDEFFELLQTENLPEKKFVVWLQTFEDQLLDWYRTLQNEADPTLTKALTESIAEKVHESANLSLYAQRLTHILER